MRRWAHERKKAGEKDYISNTVDCRMEAVLEGDSSGLFAETKRLWEEAGLSDRWYADLSVISKRQRKEEINLVAQEIAEHRMDEVIRAFGEEDPETGYDLLHDKHRWRTRTGSKREVGLMTSARLGGLAIGAKDTSRPANTCQMCQQGVDETRSHVLLACEAYSDVRREALGRLKAELPEGLWKLFANDLSPRQQELFLLGKKTEHPLDDLESLKARDRTVKSLLLAIDDRRIELGGSSMLSRVQTTPTEITMRLAQEWDEAHAEETWRRSQAYGCR